MTVLTGVLRFTGIEAPDFQCYRRGSTLRNVACIAVFCLLQACAGALGGTKSFVLDIDPPAGEAPQHVVEVSSVSVSPDANELDSVGTYHVGKIGDSEVADIKKSLADTLGEIDWPASAATETPLDIHLLVSRYYVAHSNNDGAILACIDWALVSGPQDIVFSERFFASVQASDLEGLNTLGKAKNTLNAQVIRRVVEKSLRLAADPGETPVLSVAHTYETLGDAAAPLPTRLTSLFGLPSFSTKGVDWTTGAPTAPADWSTILGGGHEAR